MTIRGRLATTLAVLLTLLLTGAPLAAPAAFAEDNCYRPQDDQQSKPDLWAQRRLSLPRVWEVETGQGVTVAVIDSGIDVTRQHLDGDKVRAGPDILGPPNGPSTKDCTGHGTGVAAILAGHSVGGLPFAGVAPNATVLSIRTVEKGNSRDSNRGSPAQLVHALDAAVAAHVQVINISAGIQRDEPAVRAAIENALRHDIVIVASAGNDDQDASQQKPAEAAKPCYPAAYPGVIAVAATGKNDERADISHAGSYVDIAAPGDAVMTVAANGPAIYVSVGGTSYAAPFVAGTAALVRAYRPKLTQAQVVSRILATADVLPVGRGTPQVGAGIVNPYAAVTAVIPAEAAAGAGAPSAIAAVSPASPRVVDNRARNRALAGAGLACLLAVLVLAVAALFPRGQQRRWRPGRTAAPVERNRA